MSSANFVIFKWFKSYPLFKKAFLYHNFNVRNLKLLFKSAQYQFGGGKIIKILKKNNYTLKFKTFVNYFFIKKEKIKRKL